MNVYGITGTNGKTTTTWVLAEFLKPLGRVGYVTTVEVDTGARKFSTGYTTPPNKVLMEIFAEMEANGLVNCVMEASSHAIHQNRTAGTNFVGGAFTNLSEDHLDYHKTMEAYFAAKRLFFERLAAERPGAPAVVCVDGDWGRRLADELGTLPLNVISCGFSVPHDADFADFVSRRSPLAGRYNVQNVLVAAALARAAGVSEEAIRAAVPSLVPRWGRLERVRTRSEAEVFVDFAHTDDALANVLSTVRAFTKGRVWAVFGAGGDRDRAKRPLMGAAAARCADCLVVTSDNPRSERPEDIIAEILAGIPAGAAVTVEPDRRAAIHYALAHAARGDTVIVCGKGHETTQTIGARVLPFDDRIVCAEY